MMAMPIANAPPIPFASSMSIAVVSATTPPPRPAPVATPSMSSSSTDEMSAPSEPAVEPRMAASGNVGNAMPIPRPTTAQPAYATPTWTSRISTAASAMKPTIVSPTPIRRSVDRRSRSVDPFSQRAAGRPRHGGDREAAAGQAEAQPADLCQHQRQERIDGEEPRR